MEFSTFTLMSILMYAFLPPSLQDPNDQSCLTNLLQSMHVPNHNLQNWTKPNLANPCLGSTSNLVGATCNNGRIYKLSLSNFSLHGPISPYISNCTSLQSLDLSNNSLTGPIPTEFQYLVNLTTLNLSSNHLTGPIPPQLGSLVRLLVFDVSDNKLSGPIPENLLRNRTGNLSGYDVTSYSGDEDLYGCPMGPLKGNGLSMALIVWIGLGSGLFSLVLSYVLACYWLRVADQKMAAEEDGKNSQLMPEY